MIRRIQIFLGPERLRALFLLLAVTGLLSLVLNAIDAEWVTGVQTLLVLTFLVGAAVIVGTALDPYDRGRWLGILAPAFGLIVLGVTVLQNISLVLFGGALGWVVAGLFIFNPRGPMEYQQAIKHLRKNEYADAVKVMDALIKDEPNNTNHYRFRAEVMRLWGKLDRARRDYRKMADLEPESAVAYNGLAEVNLQAGDYNAALKAGERAHELAPDEWVAAYNLGMIEDRLGEWEAAIQHLNEALVVKVPDKRHRLLIHFYLVRAHAHLGDAESVARELENLKAQSGGLREWHTILGSDQAETLRAVIQDDVDQAEQLINDEIEPSVLVSEDAR